MTSKTFTLDIDVSEGEDSEFFSIDCSPEKRRLIIDLGVDTFNECREFITIDDQRVILNKLKKKLKEKFQREFLQFKIESEQLKKQLELVKEQNEFLKSELTQTRNFHHTKIDKMIDTCDTIKLTVERNSTKDFIDNSQRLVINYLLHEGFSVGIKDFIDNSSKIGKIGEETLLDVLNTRFPKWEFKDAHAEGHQGDIHCISPSGNKIMIDSKKFKANVGKKDREKFYDDMVANPDFCAGILFSHESGIATKSDLDMELVDGKLVTYICYGMSNLSKLDLVFYFIDLYINNNTKLCIKDVDLFTTLLKNCNRRNTSLLKSIDVIEKNAKIMREKLIENISETKELIKMI